MHLRANCATLISLLNEEDDVTKPQSPIPDADETRAGYRSGEGVDSVLKHLMASARRRAKRMSEAPDTYLPSQLLDDAGGPVDIPLPP